MEQEFDHALDRVEADQHTPWGKLRYEQVSHNLTPHLRDTTLHVLDAGGGNGAEAVRLAEMGHHVTILDLSTRSMRDACTRAETAGVTDRIEYHTGDIRYAGRWLDNREFDMILCHNAIQYLPDPGAGIRALARLLRTNGVLSILAPNPDCDPLTAATRGGDLNESRRLLDTNRRFSVTYGREYICRSADEIASEIISAGLNPPTRYGVRTVCDLIIDNQPKHDPEFFGKLLDLENTLTARRPYLELARYFHLIATKPDHSGGIIAQRRRRRVGVDATDVAVRSARPGDIPAMVQLRAAVAEEKRWIGVEPPIDRDKTAATLRKGISAADQSVFVGDHLRSGIVASATVGFTAPGITEITMLVDADQRGRGIGTLLLDRLIDWSSEHHAHKISLRVWPHNLPAIRLYQGAEFEIEGTLRSHHRRDNGELWDVLIMSRVL